MADLENYLLATLYRSSCPDFRVLGEYELKLLPAAHAEQVQKHLLACPYCTDEVKQLRAFQAELAPDLEVSRTEQVKTWIARLIPDLSSGGRLAPALGIRGTDAQILAYEAGDAQLSLIVQEDPVRPDRRSLLGLLIGAEPEGVRVSLLQKDRLSTLGTLDDLGNFIIAGVQPGSYELTLRGATFEIYVAPLSIA